MRGVGKDHHVSLDLEVGKLSKEKNIEAENEEN